MPFLLGLFKSPKMMVTMGLIIVLSIMGFALRHYYVKNDENQKQLGILAKQIELLENEIKTVNITQNVTNEVITDVIKAKEEQEKTVRSVRTDLQRQIQSIKSTVTNLDTIVVTSQYEKDISKARMNAVWDLYCKIDNCVSTP